MKYILKRYYKILTLGEIQNGHPIFDIGFFGKAPKLYNRNRMFKTHIGMPGMYIWVSGDENTMNYVSNDSNRHHMCQIICILACTEAQKHVHICIF